MVRQDYEYVVKKPILEKTLSTPADFTDPEALFERLKNTIHSYRPGTELELIERAYTLAAQLHKDQVRKSGEPYIIHPLCVAIILAELELDKETIAAGILHDVVEDTDITLDEIRARFGDEIALLVDGVTKITQLNYDLDKVEVQAENLRKMFLAMAKDIRVIMIKLADRLHNMRTMQYQPVFKQQEKAHETMDIYAPLAQRLGISRIKVELDDLSLKIIEPEVYADLEDKIELRKSEREQFMSDRIDEIAEKLEEGQINAQIDGRIKHFFSIYKKMKNQNKTLDQIYDLYAIRIIVDSVKDCYAALGIMHEMYKPIPGRFKDYIAMPKANNYQSLHTTLIGPNGTPFEIQIRTMEMHKVAEYGIAAHWKYKEAQNGVKSDASLEEKMQWLRQILEWQKDMSDNREFLSNVKSDLNLFSDSVYCFTPTGDVKTLPTGSTPIDFAYSIHSAVGNKMVGARANGRLVTLDYVIQNGDRIEVLTSQNSKGPSRDWLNICKSGQAKNKINQWFKTELKEDNVVHGKELILAYCKAKAINPQDVLKPEFMDVIMKKYGFHEWDAVLAAIGHGGVKEGQIVNRLLEEAEKKEKREMTDEQVMEAVQEAKESRKPVRIKSHSSIIVQGTNDVAVRFSKCCSPVPGDEICGFVTRGRGISIHRTDCINVLNASDEERIRMIPAEWSIDDKQSGTYFAEINIYAHNRSGIILDVSKVMTENKIDMSSVNSHVSKNGVATTTIGFEVSSTEMLATIIGKLRQIEGVMDVERTMG